MAYSVRHVVAAFAAVAFLAARPTQAQQATGIIRGHAHRAGADTPLPNAQIAVVGTGLGTLSAADGSFTIPNVPAGPHTLRVRLIGYAPLEQPVTVTAGGTATADLALSERAMALDEIVVTGTAGQARQREVGNSIGQIKIADVPEPSTNVSNMLQGRVAGVSVVQSGGSSGSGSSIRLRGNSSVALSNQPLIYIDGVRVRSDAYPKNVPATGYQGRSPNVTASPLNDINPDDIERVEIIKGAAATTLYGTEAASGVIQIFTKRGATGAASWTANVRQGINQLRPFGIDDAYPANTPSASYLYIDPWLRNGRRQGYSLSVGGGTQAGLRYFVSGDYDDNQGVLPKDDEQKYNMRANFGFSPMSKLQLDWNTSYTNDDISNTPAGNNAHGLTLNAFRRDRNYFGSADKATIDQVLTYDINSYVRRFILGGTATYTPFEHLTNRLTLGLDRADVENRNLRPYGFVAAPQGIISDQRWNSQTLTVDYVGSLDWLFRRALHSTFSWGAQSSTVEVADVSGYAEGFPGPGVPTVSSGAQQLAFENRQRVINAGFFVQELIGFKDRYFLTFGTRVDGNSAFGQNLGLQVYPKVSASYVISDEPFWREHWGTMKLRAAYGQAGRAPGAFDAVQTWSPVGWGGQPAFRPLNVGNPNLGPERTAELELGFDAAVLNQRLTLDFTYFNSKTTDALLPVSQIPSLGFLGTQLENVGKLKKTGIEVGMNASLLQARALSWDVGVTFATNHSQVVSLGGAPAFELSNFGWVTEGQPVPVLRGRYITNANAIADPIIEENHYFGPSQPTKILGVRTGFKFLHGVELSARGEYMGGNYLQEDPSFESLSRAVQWPTCFHAYRLQDAGQSNQLTARERALCNAQNVRADMFIYPADFFKLRDITLSIPVGRLLRGTKNAQLSLSALNWYTWKNKNFPLFDPEMAGNGGFNESVRYISEQIPAPATFLAQLRITF